jgi:hypothetical protein
VRRDERERFHDRNLPPGLLAGIRVDADLAILEANKRGAFFCDVRDD